MLGRDNDMHAHLGGCQTGLGNKHVQHLWTKGCLRICATSDARARFLFSTGFT